MYQYIRNIDPDTISKCKSINNFFECLEELKRYGILISKDHVISVVEENIPELDQLVIFRIFMNMYIAVIGINPEKNELEYVIRSVIR